MHAASPGVHLYSSQGGRKAGGADPDTQIGRDMGRGIRYYHRLKRRRQNCDKTRSREGCGAVAAKLCAARHLPAYAADVAQRSVQIIHALSLYTAKYPEEADLSRYLI